LALPQRSPWQGEHNWPWKMHGMIADALHYLGIQSTLQSARQTSGDSGPLCFHQCTDGDLMIASHKIAGSAQRRQRGGLLQHGAVLLAQSPYAPSLPGILELTGRWLIVEEVCTTIARVFREQTGWLLEDAADSPVSERAQELARTKYSQDKWN